MREPFCRRLVPKPHWRQVPLEVERGPTSRWLDAGCSCNPCEEGHCLPTAVRAIKREAPPFRPAGVEEQCEDYALQMWLRDDFCVPPYQYREVNYVCDPR